jgi:hypothetical protein
MEARKQQQLARGKQDKQKGEEAIEQQDPFVLDPHEVSWVTEAIAARISLLQTLPASEWRDSRLGCLNSFLKQLDQLLEEVQLEPAVRMGMD